jgi:hypothetical protein
MERAVDSVEAKKNAAIQPRGQFSGAVCLVVATDTEQTASRFS